ncbi:hypothetical protein DEJ50_20885 [Streptomyces venezuelae]|uniref:DUF192 domain-containing protein n=1 Tax=Streptomyces venezuelae TaxID=54571 RepID=A0A5P2D424_STRVZ|nr:DUF192 domain-containing protein [Streptomyces venezuelae]QES49912.1 hypothetical protein DEJ50_20885 [Streptomyces venezuelae]
MRHPHFRDGPALLRIGADAAVVAVPLEIAASYRARTRGLLGRDGIEGALLLTPAASVHTFRMRFAIDVAYLDRAGTVLAVTTMRPGRLGLPRLRARRVLEAEAGAMAGWGIRRGVRLSIEPGPVRSPVRADRTAPEPGDDGTRQGPGQAPARPR